MKALKRTTAGIGMLAVGAAALLLAGQPQTARAGDQEWATAGKILAGVVGVHILLNGLPQYGGGVTVHETRVSYGTAYHCPPPQPVVHYRVYRPAPPVVVVRHAPVPRRRNVEWRQHGRGVTYGGHNRGRSAGQHGDVSCGYGGNTHRRAARPQRRVW